MNTMRDIINKSFPNAQIHFLSVFVRIGNNSTKITSSWVTICYFSKLMYLDNEHDEDPLRLPRKIHLILHCFYFLFAYFCIYFYFKKHYRSKGYSLRAVIVSIWIPTMSIRSLKITITNHCDNDINYLCLYWH